MGTKPAINAEALREILSASAFEEPTFAKNAKLALAALVAPIAPPFARNLLELAARAAKGEASESDLSEGRVEAWTYLGSLACYCSETDSLSVQITMTALDSATADRATLFSISEKLRRAGVAEEAIFATLQGALG